MKFLRSLLVIALTIGATTISAQERRVKEEGKIIFNPHWFMQIQGGAAHTIGETKFGDLISPAAALNVGYQFSPVFGLRAGASGWQARGSWVSPREDYKFKYIQGNLDAMVNLNNLFCEFKPERTFNVYTFLGVAYNHGFDNDEAVAIDAKIGKSFSYLWEDSKDFFVGRGGLGLNIRLNDYLGLNVEANANALSDHFNSKKAGNLDWQFNGLVGLTIKFGKGYTKTETTYYEVPAQPVKPVEEVAPKEEPKPIVKPVEVKVEPMTQNVSFKINSSTISADQQSKITELVNYLNTYPEAKVTITGYADKGTGNASINMRLSKERAARVAEALKAKGIAADRIQTDAKGDTVQPFAVNEDNRVSICITK